MVLPNSNLNPGNEPGNQPPATSSVTPAVNPPATNPGNSVDWESQYKGLQGTYQKLFDDHARLKIDYENLNQEHEKTKQDLVKAQTDLTEKDNAVKTKDTDILTKQEALKKSESEKARLKMIAEEFPLLLDMELKGLVTLDDDDPAKLKEKLKALNDAIAVKIDQKAINNLSAIPPSSNPPGNNLPPTDIEQIATKLESLAGSKKKEDQTEYQKLYQTYMTLLEQKPK